jgi:hypothetical protein
LAGFNRKKRASAGTEAVQREEKIRRCHGSTASGDQATVFGDQPTAVAAAIIEHALDFDGRYGVHTSPRDAARTPANPPSSNCGRGGTPPVPSGQDR